MKSSSQQTDQKHITSLTGFLKDVMRLAVYAVERGSLPEEIHMDELYRMWEIKITQQRALSDLDVAYLQHCYLILSRELSPTTAISLRATEALNASTSKDYMNTDAGRHVRNMWYASFAALATIVLMNLYQYIFELNAAVWAINNASMFNNATYLYSLVTTLTPFMYGAFGASVFLLRQAETQLRERTFDPRRLPEFRNRLVLGTLSGGVIVLLYSSGGVAETNVKITEAALGFIGGYSIDLLFSLLDRVVDALKPQEKSSTCPPRTPAKSAAPKYSKEEAPPAKQPQDSKEEKSGAKNEKETTPQLIPVANKGSDSVA